MEAISNNNNNKDKRGRPFCGSAVLRITVLVSAISIIAPIRLNADVVTDWNQIMVQTAITGKTSPLVSSRVTAIVEAAVFDAVNGIERPLHDPFTSILPLQRELPSALRRFRLPMQRSWCCIRRRRLPWTRNVRHRSLELRRSVISVAA